MIVSIEGNIGAGKSTLLKHLSESGYHVVEEDVESWKSEGWLNLFYSDMKRFSGTFQLRTQLSHIENAKKFRPNQLNVVERSPLSNKMIFGSTLLDDGYLHPLEYNIIDQVNRLVGWTPDHLIVLACDPKVCLQRIESRGRPGESIPLSYLESLHEKHMLLHQTSSCPSLLIDTTYLSPEQVFEQVHLFLKPDKEKYFSSDVNYVI
jgi:deoxyadenosine/deoxycytidine kinase